MTFENQPPREDREALRRLVITVLAECRIDTVELGESKEWEDYDALLRRVSGVVQLAPWQSEQERTLALMAERRGKLVLPISATAINESAVRHAVVAELWTFADAIFQQPSDENTVH